MAQAQFRVAQERGTRRNTFFYHIEDGLHYHESDSRQGTTYYKCVRAGRGCRGRATFDGVDGFVHTSPHNHDPDPIYPEEMALRRNILRRCENLEYLTFPRIIFQEGRRFGPEAVARCTYDKLRTSMRNARMKRYPPLPANLTELTEILQNQQYQVLTLTDDGLYNIYAGSVDDADGNHHLLFMSERMIERARTFSVLHSDGTFRSVPCSKEFASQVFCIVGVWTDHIITLGWALMSSLTENAYTAVLQLFRQLLGPQIELTRAISDFETAEQNGWRNVFGVRVQGCLWHFCRALLIMVAELNLLIRMRRIEEVRVIIRLTMGLPLLPEDMIIQGYRVILQHAIDEGGYIYRIARPYLTYVWRSWVSRPWRRARMCVYNSRQRTNNCCESQNHQLNDEAGTHSNIYMFLNSLVRLEQRAHNTVLALNDLRRVTRARRRSSIYNDAQVMRANEELLNPPGPLNAAIFRFLLQVSHTMDNMVEELIAEVGARRR